MNQLQFSMQQLQLNPQGEKMCDEFNKEMENMIMLWEAWDNSLLEEWYLVAIEALKFANVKTLGIPQQNLSKLLVRTKQGLSMYAVQHLSNNLEYRSAHEMQLSIKAWADFLANVNSVVAESWQRLSMPHQEKLYKESEIMNRQLKS